MHETDVVVRALSLARLRAVHLRPYYATALYRLIPVLTSIIDTLAVDRWWRLYYNRGFVERCTPLELATSLLHEVEHLLRNHHGRCASHGCDHELFNIAGDLEINDGLHAQTELALPPGVLLPARFGLPDGLAAEEYYREIEKAVQEVRAAVSSGKIQLPKCGSGAHGKKLPSELGDPNNKDRGVGDEQADYIRKKVAEETLDYERRHPGTVPGGLLRWANDIVSPKIPWQRELAAAIRNQVTRIAGMIDHSFMRPSRRQTASPDFVLPSLVEPTPNIVVVIDTSGSMSEEQLAQALAEVKGILRATGIEEGLRVLTVDAAVGAAQTVFSARAIKLVGGGGTDMGVGIAAAGALKPIPDFTIVITDGFTPWPAEAPPRQRVIVVLVGDGAGPPWARTIKAA